LTISAVVFACSADIAASSKVANRLATTQAQLGASPGNINPSGLDPEGDAGLLGDGCAAFVLPAFHAHPPAMFSVTHRQFADYIGQPNDLIRLRKRTIQ
jgi:hypothetical protein